MRIQLISVLLALAAPQAFADGAANSGINSVLSAASDLLLGNLGERGFASKKSDVSCEAFFQGAYFDAGKSRCIAKGASACTNPFPYEDLISCEFAHKHEILAPSK